MRRTGSRMLTWIGDRPVAQFALTGLAAVVLLGLAGVTIFRASGTREAIRDARGVTRLAWQGVAAPYVTKELLAGQPRAIARLDRVVRRRILRDPVVRVKVWTRQGRIVYSDERRLIGSRYPLGEDERDAIASGGTDAEVSNLSAPENHFERSQSKLLEVYLGVRARDGTPLLFETYDRFSSVSASGRRLWLAFAPALLGALLLLEAVQIPLAARLARRLRRGQREREALLRRAVESSEIERRRIARDLHDGVVQNLAGVSYSLAAAQEELRAGGSPAVGETLERSAAEVRRSIRELRTLLVDLYPASLHQEGLEAALSDLLAPLGAQGITAELRVEPGIELGRETEAVVFRSAQEAVRNALRHGRAQRIDVDVERRGPRVSLEVRDDGQGFDPSAAPPGENGHLGLRFVADAVQGLGGRLEVESAPGSGARIRVEVPAT